MSVCPWIRILPSSVGLPEESSIFFPSKRFFFFNIGSFPHSNRRSKDRGRHSLYKVCKAHWAIWIKLIDWLIWPYIVNNAAQWRYRRFKEDVVVMAVKMHAGQSHLHANINKKHVNSILTLGEKLPSEKNPKSKLTLPPPAAVGKTAVEWLSSSCFFPPASFLTNEKENQAGVREGNEQCCTWRMLHVTVFCERAPPLKFISKVSEPMLNVKELFGLLWNFLSMSEHFTGLVLPLESCSQIKNKSINRPDKKIKKSRSSITLIYLFSVLAPLPTQGAVPEPHRVPIVQPSHL